MTDRGTETNRQTYSSPEVAAHYASLDYLTPCERLLFETHIEPGGAILDLGVGGGRTTTYLSSRASRYVGVDYAAAMISACQAKFPALEFVVADAADLSAFASASFDAVVFAFNGLDYVLPEQARRACLRHIHRILKPAGVVIFSSHNPRAVLVPPSWNSDRLRRTAQQFTGGLKPLYWPLLAILTAVRAGLAVAQSVAVSLYRLAMRIPSRAFWRGEGDLVDSVHGGLLTHYGTPGHVMSELSAIPFQLVQILGNRYPRISNRYTADWYYYVFAKPTNR